MASVRWTREQLSDYQKRRLTQHPAPLPREMRAPPRDSKIERRFAQQLAEAGIFEAKEDEPRGYLRNYFLFADRDFELDFAWPGLRVAVEVQGMAHRIKGKFKRDIEKRALALLAGWRVLEVDGESVRDGRAIKWALKLLAP